MKKILIVDDEQALLYGMPKAIHKFCNFQGEIKTARNGNDAIKEIGNDSYDICFLDYHLPDLDGLEIMKKIKKASPKTHVVIMTADFMTYDMEKTIIENGASLLIEKPIDLYEVMDFIKHALEENGGSCEEEKSYQKITDERRQFERLPFNGHIYYYVLKNTAHSELKLHMKAVIIDISSKGMGIRTDYPLEHGQRISFTNNILEHTAGLVKWSTMVDNNYMAGIIFIR